MQPALPGPILDPFGHDAAHERGNTIETGSCRRRPAERRNELASIADTDRLDDVLRLRFIGTRGIRGEDVALERERASPTPAAQLLVLAPPALAAEPAFSDLPEQRRLGAESVPADGNQ